MLRLMTALLIPLASMAGAQDALSQWQDSPAAPIAAQDVSLSDFHWRARPIIVFADSPEDPRFIEQMQRLSAHTDELVKRDVVLITDTAPTPPSALRTRLRPRSFMLVLMGKDGQVKLRKPFPWTLREISRSIDKMPLRKQEMRDRHGG